MTDNDEKIILVEGLKRNSIDNKHRVGTARIYKELSSFHLYTLIKVSPLCYTFFVR